MSQVHFWRWFKFREYKHNNRPILVYIIALLSAKIGLLFNAYTEVKRRREQNMELYLVFEDLIKALILSTVNMVKAFEDPPQIGLSWETNQSHRILPYCKLECKKMEICRSLFLLLTVSNKVEYYTQSPTLFTILFSQLCSLMLSIQWLWSWPVHPLPYRW